MINFSFADGRAGKPEHEKTIDYRGHVLDHVVSTEDNEGPWRIALRGNRPLKLGNSKGRFGFFVVSDVGSSLSQFLPEDFDERALCNADYQHLYSRLIQIRSTGEMSGIGVLLYDVG